MHQSRTQKTPRNQQVEKNEERVAPTKAVVPLLGA